MSCPRCGCPHAEKADAEIDRLRWVTLELGDDIGRAHAECARLKDLAEQLAKALEELMAEHTDCPSCDACEPGHEALAAYRKAVGK